MKKLALLLLLAAPACGKSRPAPARDAAPAALAGADAGPAGVGRPLGLTTIAAFQFTYGKGAKDFKRAQDAYKAKDWPTVQAACEAALASDPDHLDAHRLLASALAQKDGFAAAAEHLNVVLAADLGRYAGELDKDAELAKLLASPWGAPLKAQEASYRTAYLAAVKSGLLLVGRRGPFREPQGQAAVYTVPGAELYAYDLAGKRYLRVTRTGSAIAAFERAPSGDEIAYAAWSKVTPGAAGAPTLLVDPRVGTINLLALEAPVVESKLKNVRGIGFHYETGDKLVVTSYVARGSQVARAVDYEVDKATGKLQKLYKWEPADERIVTYESVEHIRLDGSDGITAVQPEGSPGLVNPVLTSSSKPIALPEGQLVAADRLFWSPTKQRLAFATVADPCAEKREQRQSSLYVVDATTGQLKHLARGEYQPEALWLDDERLVYEDAQGALRVYQAAQALELDRLTSRGGLALVGLGARTTRVCRQSSNEAPGSFEWQKETFAPLAIGMTVSEVEAALGPPDKRPALQSEAATGDFVASWTWKRQGISLTLRGSSESDAEPTVRSIRLQKPSPFRTAKGVGIGSTREEILAAYGAYQEEESPADAPEGMGEMDPDPNVLVIGSIYGGLIFHFENNRVSWLFLGAGAE